MHLMISSNLFLYLKAENGGGLFGRPKSIKKKLARLGFESLKI